MFKKLLVPLDGSKLSESVLPVVRELVEGTQTEVTLFAVGHTPRPTEGKRQGPDVAVPLAAGAVTQSVTRGIIPAALPSYAESPGQAIERLESELLEHLTDAGRALEATGAHVTTAVHFGEPAAEIITFAQHGGFDAIVMATHGRSGLSKAVHGSVTTDLIRSGVAPVLVVRPAAEKVQ